MKKRLTVITLLLMLCTTMFGQDHYNYTTGDYPDNMIVRCKFTINGKAVNNEKAEIAAFAGDELRSEGAVIKQYGYFSYANLTIYGEKSVALTFKLWCPDEEGGGEEYITDYSLDFVAGGMVGSAANPIVIDFYQPYWNYTGAPMHTMNYTFTAKLNGEKLDRTNVEVAAFAGDKLLGCTKPKFYNINGGISLFTLSIAGNNNDIVTFQLYDHSDGTLYYSDHKITYVQNTVLGDLNEVVEFQSATLNAAKIGDTEYPTLSEALKAVKVLLDTDTTTQTITLLRDIPAAESVVIDMKVIIDFNNHDYVLDASSSQQRSSDGVAFQINKVFNGGKANRVTLKNGTIKVAEGCEDFNTLVKNYADLTIEDMTFEGDNLDLGESSHVLSFVSGVAHVKRSTINANVVEGETHYSFGTTTEDGYSNPVVNLYLDDDYNTIDGLVEYTGGSIIGNTGAGLEVVAKKSFDAVSGEYGSREGWGTISTPVYTEGTNGVDIPVSAEPGSPFANHDIYKYDEPTAMWKFYNNSIENSFSTFDLGHGYLYANRQDITLELQGKLAYDKKEVTFTITYDENAGAQAGFNFIGNPFLCQISSKQIKSDTHVLADGFFVVSSEGAFVPNDPKYPYVRPMESVMIQLTPKSTEPSAKIGSFKTKVTIHPTPVAKERSAENNGSLAINVSNENYSDVAYVSFSENIGLNKVAHYNDEIPMVSVSVDGAEYAIATMSQDVTEIPVSFKAAQMGEYTIGVEARDCEYSTMTLVDRMTGIETNLLLEDYTFLAKSGDNTGRFIIKLAMANGNDNGNENFAYINNGMMYIYNIEGQGVINIYDVTGRPVAEYNVAESASISTTDFAAGMYIIRMSDENGVKVQKIVVE